MIPEEEFAALREQLAQLTARVYRLEQLLSSSAPAAAQAPPLASISPPAPIAARATIAAPPSPAALREDMPRPLFPADESESLERRIGSRWLNRVGVVAVLVGVSYFLKLAFDNGWIGPGLRVLIGLIAGVGLCWWSERFRRADSRAFSYSLKAVGIGALYLSLWAGFQLYHLMPGAVAFLAMILVTVATAAMALAQDAELLAGLALLGGMLTPMLCSSGENHEAVLFCYLFVISAGAFVLQRYKPWPRILFGAFLGTAILGVSWYAEYYTASLFSETLLLLSLLFALFAAAPLYAVMGRGIPTGHSALVLAIGNAYVFYGAVYDMLAYSAHEAAARAFWAFLLAVVFAALALALERRSADRGVDERLLPTLHWAIAISLLTLALALRLRAHWITVAWLLEGGLLYWAAAAARRSWPRLFAAFIVLMGLVRLFCYDLMAWGTLHLLLNPRLFTMLLAIAILLWMLFQERRGGTIDLAETRDPGSQRTQVAVVLAVAVVNIIALTACVLEIRDFFEAILLPVGTPPWKRYEAYAAHHNLVILRGFCYSALFMLYAAALMWLGFVRRLALLRWQAMALMACTILKAFLWDTSELEHGWRVLSFIILGAILLGVSYAYQKDWLGLQQEGHG